MKRIISLFLDYKLVITIASFFSVYKSNYILDIKIDLLIFQFLLLFATFLVYNHNKIFYLLKKNGILIKHIMEFSNLSIFSQLSILLLIISLVTIIECGIIAAPIFAVLFILSIFYNIPITNQNGSVLTIRKLPYLKIFLISFVWAAVSSLIVIKFNLDSLLIFFQYFSFILAITIPFDIRDKEMDKSAKIRTLSHKFNDKQLIAISLVLLIFNLILSIYLLFITNKINLVYAEIILFLYLILLLSVFEKLRYKKYYYELLDFSILLYGLLYIDYSISLFSSYKWVT